MVKISNDLDLPAEIAGRRTAIFGISGSGKSNTHTVIVEGLLNAGEQFIGIDPKGEGWGLLSLANGKPSNLDVIIFGEPNGHISPLHEKHGVEIADFVVETGKSVILSLLGFESDQSERRFVASFLRQLYRRKSKQQKPTRTLVGFDEAHLFIPESAGRGFKGDAAELAGACQRIVRQGRSVGLGSLVVDQRPQDVAKRIISQCDTLICHQLVHKTDRDALRDWVRGYDRDGSGEQFLDSVASLQPGEAWIWSPAWLRIFQRVNVVRRRTFDSGAAPDGSAAARTVQRAEVDIESLRGQLANVVEEAKANDPGNLRSEISDLKRKITELEREAKEPANSRADPVYLLDQEALKALNDAVNDLREAEVDRVEQFFTTIKNAVATFGNDVATGEVYNRLLDLTHKQPEASSKLVETVRRATVAPPKAVPTFVVHSAAQREISANGSLPPGERKILTAIAQYSDRGGAEREQVGLLTGYKATSRNEYIKRLKGSSYVEERDKLLYVTSSGIAVLGDFEPLPTGKALQDYWLQRLPPGEGKVLNVVLVNYPAFVGREFISDSTDYKATSRNEYIKRLKTKKLVETNSEGVKASDLLF